MLFIFFFNFILFCSSLGKNYVIFFMDKCISKIHEFLSSLATKCDRSIRSFLIKLGSFMPLHRLNLNTLKPFSEWSNTLKGKITSLSHSIYGDPDTLPIGVEPVETSDLFPLTSFSGLISSTILTTSFIFGLFSGNFAVQTIPI